MSEIQSTIVLEAEVVQSGWMMFHALELSETLTSARIAIGYHTTVVIPTTSRLAVVSKHTILKMMYSA